MIKRCYLNITSFVGMSVGARHYYGSLLYSSDGDYRKIELKYKLTPEDAQALSTRDYKYQAGTLSERFDSEEEIIALGLKSWKKHFPDVDILLKGDSGYGDPQPCLAGPKKIKDKINQLWKRGEEIGGYEGNDELMTKISDEYCALIKNKRIGHLK